MHAYSWAASAHPLVYALRKIRQIWDLPTLPNVAGIENTSSPDREAATTDENMFFVKIFKSIAPRPQVVYL